MNVLDPYAVEMEVLGTGLNGESYRREVCRAKSKLITDHMSNFGLSQNVEISVYSYVGETIEINFLVYLLALFVCQ